MRHAGARAGDELPDGTRRMHRLLITTFVTLFVPLTCFGAYSINRFEKLDTLENEALGTARRVAEEVGRLQTAMSVLTSMHHLLQDYDETLPSLARTLREQAPWITAMGRYRQIGPEQRAPFEARMELRGRYDFRIRDLDASGGASVAPVRDRAFPVAALEPMSPRNLPLFGADLAGVPGVSAALSNAAATGRDHLTTVPSGWPAGGQFMLFSPVYRGMTAPREPAERVRQADGGYWLIIDPDAMLGSAESRQRRFDVAIEVRSPGGTDSLRQLPALSHAGLTLSRLYRPHTLEQSWPFGTSSLTVRMSARYGLSHRTMTLTALLLVLVAGLLALLIAASRQKARRLLEQEKGRRALDAERRKAQKTLDAISDAVITVDPQARVRRVNPAGALLLGQPADALCGQAVGGLIALQHAGPVHEEPRPFDLVGEIGQLPARVDRRFELGLSDPDGHADRDTGLQASLSRTGGPGDDDDVIIVLRDTSAERRFTRELEYQANHDALTGCTNRHHFERQLERLADAGTADDPGHALLYMDLDQFKAINDTAGHAAGDRLLVELTGELRAMLRERDILCRLGGDEFGMIIVDVSRTAAREIAERIHRAFQSLVFSHDGHAFAVRASLGLVHRGETDGSADGLMAAADIACYAAKEGGRNGLHQFRAGDGGTTMRSNELNWLPRLQRALDRDEFRLHAQPIVPIGADPGGSSIVHYELLLRLHDDDGREIPAGQIVQAAERYGLMREIDRWVIARAMTEIAGATAAGVRAGFSINLSGQSAADATLIEFIRTQYAQHGIDPSRVWFEITETAAISHFATAVELAGQIRALGSRIALDDFGSGLSSFGYLKNLPVDVLKIDGQFVRELASNPIDREMVRAISQIARVMGIRTVAEFVEDRRTLEVLAEIGIDYAQGYHIARPAPLDEVLGPGATEAPSRRAA